MTARVMLVDDHDLLRRGLRELLRAEFGINTFIEAASVSEALRALTDVAPEVIIVDLHLADGDGIELCRQVHERWPGVRMLIFSASEDPAAIASALDAGANGYVLKGAPDRELVAAVASALEGQEAFAPSTTRIIIDETRARHLVREALRPLSSSERMVYELLTDGFSAPEIANRLNVSVKTVRNVSSSARSKLRRDDLN